MNFYKTNISICIVIGLIYVLPLNAGINDTFSSSEYLPPLNETSGSFSSPALTAQSSDNPEASKENTLLEQSDYELFFITKKDPSFNRYVHTWVPEQSFLTGWLEPDRYYTRSANLINLYNSASNVSFVPEEVTLNEEEINTGKYILYHNEIINQLSKLNAEELELIGGKKIKEIEVIKSLKSVDIEPEEKEEVKIIEIDHDKVSQLSGMKAVKFRLEGKAEILVSPTFSDKPSLAIFTYGGNKKSKIDSEEAVKKIEEDFIDKILLKAGEKVKDKIAKEKLEDVVKKYLFDEVPSSLSFTQKKQFDKEMKEIKERSTEIAPQKINEVVEEVSAEEKMEGIEQVLEYKGNYEIVPSEGTGKGIMSFKLSEDKDVRMDSIGFSVKVNLDDIENNNIPEKIRMIIHDTEGNKAVIEDLGIKEAGKEYVKELEREDFEIDEEFDWSKVDYIDFEVFSDSGKSAGDLIIKDFSVSSKTIDEIIGKVSGNKNMQKEIKVILSGYKSNYDIESSMFGTNRGIMSFKLSEDIMGLKPHKLNFKVKVDLDSEVEGNNMPGNVKLVVYDTEGNEAVIEDLGIKEAGKEYVKELETTEDFEIGEEFDWNKVDYIDFEVLPPEGAKSKGEINIKDFEIIPQGGFSESKLYREYKIKSFIKPHIAEVFNQKSKRLDLEDSTVKAWFKKFVEEVNRGNSIMEIARKLSYLNVNKCFIEEKSQGLLAVGISQEEAELKGLDIGLKILLERDGIEGTDVDKLDSSEMLFETEFMFLSDKVASKIREEAFPMRNISYSIKELYERLGMKLDVTDQRQKEFWNYWKEKATAGEKSKVTGKTWSYKYAEKVIYNMKEIIREVNELFKGSNSELRLLDENNKDNEFLEYWAEKVLDSSEKYEYKGKDYEIDWSSSYVRDVLTICKDINDELDEKMDIFNKESMEELTYWANYVLLVEEKTPREQKYQDYENVIKQIVKELK